MITLCCNRPMFLAYTLVITNNNTTKYIHKRKDWHE
jgi:hypothetical protein